MRPLCLTMTAFGPFQATETIDFERLGESPLFLINGPTGSGKTTILDAICFALYGGTTGDEREGSQMRCDHAAADTLTEVSFSFELGDARYRIRRVPEQQRPKARGEGETTQSAEAQLWRLDSAGGERLLVPNKVTEATREIEQLTGLSVSQFRQVMVLPQGKFRELLLAESRSREAIFSQLFQTHVYRQLEERLKAQSAEIRRATERMRQIQQGILEGVGIADQGQLEETLQSLQPELEQAQTERQEAEQRHARAQEALQQARHLKDGFAQLQRLQQRQAELERQRPAIEQQRQRLAQAAQAARLKPLSERLISAGEAQHAAGSKRQQASKTLATAEQSLAAAEAELKESDAQAAALDQAKQQLSLLQGYQQRAVRLTQAGDRLQSAQSAERSAQAACDAQRLQLQGLIEERERFNEQLIGQQQRLEALGDTPLQLQQLNEQVRDKSALEALSRAAQQQRQQLKEAEAQGKRLAAAHQEQVTHCKGIELAWHQGQAALLARELEGGQACPVCGSREHPAPAVSDGELPTQSAVEEARQGVQTAQDRLTEARDLYTRNKSELEGLEARIAELDQRLEGVVSETLAQMEIRQKSLTRDLESLEAARRQRRMLTNREAKLKQDEAQCRTELDRLNSELTACHAAVAAAGSEFESAVRELPAAYRKAGALEQAIGQIEGEIGRLNRALDATRSRYQEASEACASARATCQSAEETLTAAQEAVRQVETDWRGALRNSPFADREAFAQALLTETQQSELEESARAYEQQCQQTAGALRQQETALAGQVEPDLTRREQQLNESIEQKRLADQAWRQLDNRLTQLAGVADKLAANQRQCADLERQYALTGTLSDVANGQTGDKVSLQRFVLSVLLDDVLVEASQRLALMSKGRYQLLRKQDRAKGNRASGLELEVEDAYTGKCRPVATLSGGESFLAALSLALGLSEVVQAYSGGIRLDTLFIDEGFGSLDPESLDLAIRALIDLQSSGRMIGVISHVAELKEQMPLRLDISSSRQGSRVTLVSPLSA